LPKHCFKNSGKISDLVGTTKDKEDDDGKKSGIYKLNCADCSAQYIGMTKRCLKTRFKEHLADCKKPLNPDSAMAFHCITEGHKMRNEAKLLKQSDEQFKLSILESLELFKHKNQNLQNLYKDGNSPSILFHCI
jgi:GIY-YIG catalytic domain